MENHCITSICFFIVSDQDLTLEELLRQHTTRVLSTSSQRITVRRSHILDDAIGALRCGFVETKRISIHFLGESAIDEGGPRREFFMLLMGSIANNSSILTGPPGHRVLRHNTSAFQVLVYSRCYYYCEYIIMPRAELSRYTVIVLSVILSVCCKYFSSLTEN